MRYTRSGAGLEPRASSDTIDGVTSNAPGVTMGGNGDSSPITSDRSSASTGGIRSITGDVGSRGNAPSRSMTGSASIRCAGGVLPEHWREFASPGLAAFLPATPALQKSPDSDSGLLYASRMAPPQRRRPGPAGKGPRKQLTVRLPVGLGERLEAVAKTRGEPMGDLVADLVGAHIEELEGKSGLAAQEELSIDFRKTA